MNFKNQTLSIFIAGLFLIFFITSCGSETQEASQDQTSEATEQLKEDKETLKSYVNEKVAQLDEEIKKIEAKSEGLGDDMATKLDNLKDERSKLKKMADDIEGKTKEGWSKFESEVKDKANSLEKNIKDFMNKEIEIKIE